MITEDYVSFGVAKLLKENGFDGECYRAYSFENGDKKLISAGLVIEGSVVITSEDTKIGADYYKKEFDSDIEFYLAPTINMAMKWLREEHNIDIVVNPYQEEKPTQYLGLCIKNEIYYDPCEYFEKYEHAAITAIRYALKNLI